MAFTVAEVSVSTTATILRTAGAAAEAVKVKGSKGVKMWVGPSTVAKTDGYPVEGGEPFETNLTASEVLYGITESGTTLVRVLSRPS